ncbi:MAG: amidohydrolase family protein [Gemmatimonadaceae bacterium]
MDLAPRTSALGLLVGALALGCRPTPSASTAAQPSTLITNVALLDGTGAPARPASVRIVGGRIAEVGQLSARGGETVVSGGGLVLAPGFVDTHSHADRALVRGSDALGALSQGITTVVVGQDGGSPYPLAAFFDTLERRTLPINVAAYVGHGTVRDRVMGDDFRRHATPAEVARMREMLEGELRAGALGLSTGLEYDPGIYSDRGEVLALARATAAAGGRYISHVRSEDRGFWDAVDEIIAIGRETRMPVQISHAKLAMVSLWGQGDSLIRVLDRARAEGINLTADVYPYRFWQSGLTVLFPARDYADRAAAEFALKEVAPPEGITLTSYGPDPSYEGKTVADVARLRGTDPVTTLMALVRDAVDARTAGRSAGMTIIATSMVEQDIERLLAWPWANVCTDGELDGRHPRGFGSFPRVLGHYVRERRITTFPEAVRKMTSLAADNVGLRDRGRIRPGAPADLVLLDTLTVADRATPADPHAVSVGIAKVWVNGVLAYEGGKVTGQRSGRVLRRK